MASIHPGEESEDPEVVLINLQEEKARLERLLRITEIKRLADRRNSLEVFLIDSRIINSLDFEMEDMIIDLQNIFCRQNALKDDKVKDSLLNLLERQFNYRKEIDRLKIRFNELNEKMQKTYRKTCEKREKYSSVVRHRRPMMAITKQQTIYEGRVQNAKITYATILTDNSSLRDNVDHLLICRHFYIELFQKCHVLLRNAILFMKEQLHEANLAYHHREECGKDLHTLGFLLGRKASDSLLGYDWINEKFLTVKFKTKIKDLNAICCYAVIRLLRMRNIDLRRQEYKRKIQILKERFENDIRTLHKNQKVLHRMRENDYILSTYEVVRVAERHDTRAEILRSMINEGITGLEERVETARETWRRLQETSGKEEACYMVEKFMRTQHVCLTLFTYLNKLNSEIDFLECQVRRMQKNITSIKDNMKSGQKTIRTDIKELEDQTEVINGEVSELDAKLELSKNKLDHSLESARDFFIKVGCSSDEFVEMLGGSNIQNFNVSQYIQVIECRIVDLLILCEYLRYRELEGVERKKSSSSADVLDISEKTSSLSVLLSEREPRSFGQVSWKHFKEFEAATEFLDFEDLRRTASSVLLSVSDSGSTASSPKSDVA